MKGESVYILDGLRDKVAGMEVRCCGPCRHVMIKTIILKKAFGKKTRRPTCMVRESVDE